MGLCSSCMAEGNAPSAASLPVASTLSSKADNPMTRPDKNKTHAISTDRKQSHECAEKYEIRTDNGPAPSNTSLARVSTEQLTENQTILPSQSNAITHGENHIPLPSDTAQSPPPPSTPLAPVAPIAPERPVSEPIAIPPQIAPTPVPLQTREESEERFEDMDAEINAKLGKSSGKTPRLPVALKPYDDVEDPFADLSSDEDEENADDDFEYHGGNRPNRGSISGKRVAEQLAAFAAKEAEEESDNVFADFGEVGVDPSFSRSRIQTPKNANGSSSKRSTANSAFGSSNVLPTRLEQMISSGDYTYMANKINEINQVKAQVISMNQQLNLFYNPTLVRAVMEVLAAKEIQITKAFQNEDIDDESFRKLMDLMNEVRAIIAQNTNSNTVKITRRVLGRTRTLQSVFAPIGDSGCPSPSNASGTPTVFAPIITLSSTIEEQDPERPEHSISSPSEVDESSDSLPKPSSLKEGSHSPLLAPATSTAPADSKPTAPFADIRLPVFSKSASMATTTITPSIVSPPKAAFNRSLKRNMRNSGEAREDIQNLYSVCIDEAFVSMLNSLKDDLVRLARSSNNASMATYIEEQWEALEKDNPIEPEGVSLELPTAPAATGSISVDSFTSLPEASRSKRHLVLTRSQRLAPAIRQVFAAKASLLNRCTCAIEQYHPDSNLFREIRRNVKEGVLTLEMIELQSKSHSKLRDAHVRLSSIS